MDIIGIVGGAFAKLPQQALDYIDKKAFEEPEGFTKVNWDDDTVYDVAVAFGGLPERAEKAYELYARGKVKKVLLSGGIGELTPLYDAHAEKEVNQYLKLAHNYNVPMEDILVEDEASNTEENAEKSLRLLCDQGYDLDDIAIVVVSSDFHIKRCLRVMSHYIKNLEHLTWMSVESEYRRSWQTNNRGRYYIVKEFLTNLGS